MADGKKKIAIVGGGITGLYTAYRALSAEGETPEIHLFEADSRVGGRILSEELPGIPFRAELGAMRFPTRHKLLTSLLGELGIKTHGFDVKRPRLFVRGRHLSLHEIQAGSCRWCRAGSPFNLRPNERGMQPAELVRSTIARFLKELTFPGLSFEKARDLKEKIDDEEGDYVQEIWPLVREAGRYNGISLYSIGFWNLLQHYLSNEAFQLVDIALGLDSVLGNWSVAEAIPWFLSDFGPDDFQMVPGGLERVTQMLREEIKAKGDIVHTQTKVTTVQLKEGVWSLELAGVEPNVQETLGGPYDVVILALPRRAAELLTVNATVGNENQWPPKWLPSVRPHCLYKLFLLYQEAWWMGEEEVGSSMGRIFTDLPLRQVFYFNPDWMRDRGAPDQGSEWVCKKTENWALVMASYSDEHFASFWHSSESKADEDEQAKRYGPVYYRPPANLSDDEEKKLRAQLDKISTKRRVRERTVRKIQQQLEEIHGTGVPDPICGVFRDWGEDPFGGGWHTWEVGTTPWIFENRPKITEGLYLCGEAYSDEQGWIEGALRSAESVLGDLGVAKLPWWSGTDKELKEHLHLPKPKPPEPSEDC